MNLLEDLISESAHTMETARDVAQPSFCATPFGRTGVGGERKIVGRRGFRVRFAFVACSEAEMIGKPATGKM